MLRRMTAKQVSISLWVLIALLAATVILATAVALGPDVLTDRAGGVGGGSQSELPAAAGSVAGNQPIAGDPADRKLFIAAGYHKPAPACAVLEPADRKFYPDCWSLAGKHGW